MTSGSWSRVTRPVATVATPLLVSEWVLPPLSSCNEPKSNAKIAAAVEASGAELVEALSAHGVETILVGYTVGPTVTRYELELGPGVRCRD